MKLLQPLIVALLSGMALSSCSSDDPQPATPADAQITMNVALSMEIMGRSGYATLPDALQLNYAIYQVNPSDITLVKVGDQQVSTTGHFTPVSFSLAKGANYKVMLWAAKPSGNDFTSPYTLNWGQNQATVTIDYAQEQAYTANYDAFNACAEINGATSGTHDVELTRPFAQLQIGTGDLNDSQVKAQYFPNGTTENKVFTQLSVPAYTVLDLSSGTASGKQQVTFNGNTTSRVFMPTGVTYPVQGYDYLGMYYLLEPAQGQTSESLTLSSGYDTSILSTSTIDEVPLERNKVTNLYGSFLLSGLGQN